MFKKQGGWRWLLTLSLLKSLHDYISLRFFKTITMTITRPIHRCINTVVAF